MRELCKMLSLSLILQLSACSKKPDCLKSVGTVVQQNRTINTFNSLAVHDNIEVLLTNDTVLSVTSGANLLDEISTYVENDILILENNNSCNWTRSYDSKIKVSVPCKGLQLLYQYGTEKITSATLLNFSKFIIHQYGAGDIQLSINCDYLEVDLNAIGNVFLQGKVNAMDAHIYNLGNYRFGYLNSTGMICKNLTILSETQANSYVQADSNLNAVINDNGNIFYTGNALLNLKRIGKGNMLKQ